MSLPAEVLEQVRRRANNACEYRGVTETDSGGLLTIDHIRPQSRDGADTLANLAYCCPRCNLYKADYWPERPAAPELWNPRVEGHETHFVELADGQLHPLTPVGTFTLRQLRLNRPELVDHRLQQRLNTHMQILLKQNQEIVTALEHLRRQQEQSMEEQQALLRELRQLLNILSSDI